MHPWAEISGGAGSGVYVSNDGGAKWARIDAAGLPKSPLGKIDVAIAPANTLTPIFYGHGTQDPVVPLQLGEHTRNWLTRAGCMVSWHTYPMPHSVSAEEILHIRAWLLSVLGQH